MDYGNKFRQNHPTVCGEKKVVCGGPVWDGNSTHPKMFKRPNIRPSYAKRGGSSARAISPTAVGVAADVARNVRSICVPPPPVHRWTPPTDYLFIAKHMTKAEAEPFVARCEAWFAERQREAPPTKPPPPVIDPEPLLALMDKYKGRPPCEEMCAAMLAAGHTEQRVAKYRQWWQNLEDTADARQEILDKIFAKYPSANKPAPKKKKVIKAVKKKMN